jgi:hypothetical protein
MSGWWGVDFDGTLANYEHWISAAHAGAPIERTIRRIKGWLKAKKDVRIFTARVWTPPSDVPLDEWAQRREEMRTSCITINKFCLEHFGQVLPITNAKDMHMVSLVDDRVLQVYPNTGELVQERVAILEGVLKSILYEVHLSAGLKAMVEEVLNRPKGQ